MTPDPASAATLARVMDEWCVEELRRHPDTTQES